MPSEQLSLFHSISLSKPELYGNEESISSSLVRQLEKLPVDLYKDPNKSPVSKLISHCNEQFSSRESYSNFVNWSAFYSTSFDLYLYVIFPF